MDRVESLKVERFKNGFYYNYHKHTHYSNIRTQDCVSKPIDYIERAKELGHDSYFTTEHGWQGNIFECFTLCQQNNLSLFVSLNSFVFALISSILETIVFVHKLTNSSVNST